MDLDESAEHRMLQLRQRILDAEGAQALHNYSPDTSKDMSSLAQYRLTDTPASHDSAEASSIRGIALLDRSAYGVSTDAAHSNRAASGSENAQEKLGSWNRASRSPPRSPHDSAFVFQAAGSNPYASVVSEEASTSSPHNDKAQHLLKRLSGTTPQENTFLSQDSLFTQRLYEDAERIHQASAMPGSVPRPQRSSLRQMQLANPGDPRREVPGHRDAVPPPNELSFQTRAAPPASDQSLSPAGKHRASSGQHRARETPVFSSLPSYAHPRTGIPQSAAASPSPARHTNAGTSHVTRDAREPSQLWLEYQQSSSTHSTPQGSSTAPGAASVDASPSASRSFGRSNPFLNFSAPMATPEHRGNSSLRISPSSTKLASQKDDLVGMLAASRLSTPRVSPASQGSAKSTRSVKQSPASPTRASTKPSAHQLGDSPAHPAQPAPLVHERHTSFPSRDVAVDEQHSTPSRDAAPLADEQHPTPPRDVSASAPRDEPVSAANDTPAEKPLMDAPEPFKGPQPSTHPSVYSFTPSSPEAEPLSLPSHTSRRDTRDSVYTTNTIASLASDASENARGEHEILISPPQAQAPAAPCEPTLLPIDTNAYSDSENSPVHSHVTSATSISVAPPRENPKETLSDETVTKNEAHAAPDPDTAPAKWKSLRSTVSMRNLAQLGNRKSAVRSMSIADLSEHASTQPAPAPQPSQSRNPFYTQVAGARNVQLAPVRSEHRRPGPREFGTSAGTSAAAAPETTDANAGSRAPTSTNAGTTPSANTEAPLNTNASANLAANANLTTTTANTSVGGSTPASNAPGNESFRSTYSTGSKASGKSGKSMNRRSFLGLLRISPSNQKLNAAHKEESEPETLADAPRIAGFARPNEAKKRQSLLNLRGSDNAAERTRQPRRKPSNVFAKQPDALPQVPESRTQTQTQTQTQMPSQPQPQQKRVTKSSSTMSLNGSAGSTANRRLSAFGSALNLAALAKKQPRQNVPVTHGDAQTQSEARQEPRREVRREASGFFKRRSIVPSASSADLAAASPLPDKPTKSSAQRLSLALMRRRHASSATTAPSSAPAHAPRPINVEITTQKPKTQPVGLKKSSSMAFNFGPQSLGTEAGSAKSTNESLQSFATETITEPAPAPAPEQQYTSANILPASSIRAEKSQGPVKVASGTPSSLVPGTQSRQPSSQSSRTASPPASLLTSASESFKADPRIQLANEEMAQYAGRQKARLISKGAAPADADALFTMAPPTRPAVPCSPAEAIEKYRGILLKSELSEIVKFPEIYYAGQDRDHADILTAYRQRQDLVAKNADEANDYIFVRHDHIAYRYECLSVLGKGSFGQVLQCRDHGSGHMVALKIIRNKKRFHTQALIEIKVLENLRKWDPDNTHSNVVLMDCFQFRGHLCIVTEMLSLNLYEVIKANKFIGFSTIVIRYFTEQILSCLTMLQQKHLVHCDLKPENILLRHPAQAGVKVIDFGSSCFDTERMYTYIQSRFYRSPEVILGLPYGMPIDMWSLGCILAEMFTGSPIFPGENEREQLACIIEVIGLPDRSLIDKASRRKIFFDSSGNPRPYVNSKGHTHHPNARPLARVLRSDDPLFVDFIARCLHWDPAKRLRPDQAIRHPWISSMGTSYIRVPSSVLYAQQKKKALK